MAKVLTDEEFKTIMHLCLTINSLDDTPMEIHGMVSEILEILDPIED
jgi:hypothetical protein